jgi:hypothetical protein
MMATLRQVLEALDRTLGVAVSGLAVWFWWRRDRVQRWRGGQWVSGGGRF